jgi:hypothetical protein
LRDEKQLPLETLPEPKRVPCVANAVWKGSRLLAPAGGGVSIRPDEALEPENLLPDENGAVSAEREQLVRPAAADRWWWD